MTNKKEKLKALFATGEIPFGENFAEFIDDSYNNYKIVDMFNPNQAPSEFEQGVSVLVFNFDPIENPEWDALFDGDVASGDIMVRTLRYDGAGVVIQEFDTNRNGRYYPNKSRIGLVDDTWGEMKDHPEVISVNHQKPDENGNITVDSGPPGPPGPTVDLSDDYMLGDSDVAASTKATDELYSDMNANFVQLLEDFIEHQDTKGSSTEYGHVKVDGITITSSDGVISATGGGSGTPGPQGPPGEDGKDGTKWFSGKFEPAPGEGENGDYWLNTDTGDIYYFGSGGLWNLSDGNLKGPKGEDGDPLQIVDEFGVYDSTKALSVNMGSELNDLVQNLYTSLIAHMDLKSSTTDLGHVKVDGSTITIDSNGVISAASASGFKIDNNILPSQAPSTYDVGVTVSYIPVDHANNADWLSFYGTYYYNSNSATFKMNFVVTTVKDSTDKTTQTVRMYGNKPKTNFELTTATRTSNDDADTWMTPLATMPIQRNSGTPTAWKNALAGTLYYDHSGKGWFYKKFDGANDISDLDWAPLVPSVLNVTDAPTPPTGEDFVYSAESVKEMVDTHENKKASTMVSGHVKVDGTTITANDGTISVPTASLTSRGVVQLYNSITSNSTVAATPSAVNSAIIAHSDVMASATVLGHVKVDDSTIKAANGIIKAKTKLNRIWDSRPITASATTWTVDFSDEEELTDLNNYWFEVYDDGVLVFGNPITHTVNNDNKTVTFTPQTPMSRPFTITCIGRGMEFPQ